MRVIQRVLTWLIVIAVLVCLVLLFTGQLPKLLGSLVTLAMGLLGITAKAAVGSAGVVLNEVAKGAGAREVQQKPGPKEPRHDGLNTNEPESVVGEKPRPKTPKHDSW